MSIGAMMMAVRDKLQVTFDVDAASCEVGFDGSPKPACGERYWAVHPLQWAGLQQDWDLGEEYVIGVTLTLRMGFAGKDRWGIGVFLAADNGMETLIRQTILAIHHDQAVRAAANVFITGGASGKIMTPLQLMPGGISLPRPQGPDWFSAPPPEGDYAVAECGVSSTITFGKCQRVQSVPDMD